MTRGYRAVTFDFWNTLLHADVAANRARRATALAELLERRGRSMSVEVLDAVFDRVSEQFNEAWAANRQFTVDDATSSAVTLLDIDGDVASEVVDTWHAVNESAVVTATDGIGEVLDTLSSRGLRLGIICDVGLTPSTVLRGYLDRLDLLGYFDHWSFSDEVGVYKPDARIFAHALAGLGDVGPAAVVHVGDLRRTDVAGARAAGATAVRYRGAYDDPIDADGVEAHHVIDHHRELVDILSGASRG